MTGTKPLQVQAVSPDTGAAPTKSGTRTITTAEGAHTQGAGYGKPPLSTRFQKGQSGNPKGRPRKMTKPKPPVTILNFDPALKPTDHLILEEAYRPVIIREGDKVIELPAIQAATRALAISAVKGSRLAQKALADIVQSVETREFAARLESLDTWVTYKRKWSAELKRCAQQGQAVPDPLPHPDDIRIDFKSGTVYFDGPFDTEERKKQAFNMARRAEAQDEVRDYAALYDKTDDPDTKLQYLAEWISAQYIFDLINDMLPARYKAKLDCRSNHPDASQEGRAHEHYRRLRKEQRKIKN